MQKFLKDHIPSFKDLFFFNLSTNDLPPSLAFPSSAADSAMGSLVAALYHIEP